MMAERSPAGNDLSGASIDTAPDVALLLALVPHDPWYRARTVAMGVCAIAYLWWSRTQGLVTDRISGAIAVGIFLLCAFVGKPWQRWRQVAVDAVCYASMWFAYESTRGAADRLGLSLQLDSVRTIDRVLFLGIQPTAWTQRNWYEPGVVHWHDQVLSLVYYSHFVVPVMTVASAWAVSRTMWVRYMRRFATVVVAACIMFVLLPTVPPWMAGDERFGFGVGEPLVRHVRRGVLDLGFTGFVHDWGVALDWSNVVAAMPSLHAAFSLFVVVFFLPTIRWRWARVVVFAYPLAMAVALVYFAEHWVIDVLVGWALVAGSFVLWHRLERAHRERNLTAATAALPSLAHSIDGVRTDRPTDDRPDAMMQCDPEVVLIDRSVLRAIVDVDDLRHAAAASLYGDLLDRYIDDRVQLVARRDHLEAFDLRARRSVLAPVRPVHTAAQHRRQADRLELPKGLLADNADDRLTLVVARRERAGRVVVAWSLASADQGQRSPA